MIQILFKIAFLLLTSFVSHNLFAGGFHLINKDQALLIYTVDNEKPVVRTAITMFINDMEAVSGMRPQVQQSIDKSRLIAGTIGIDNGFDQWLKKEKVPVDEIKGEWEAFKIQVIKRGNNDCLLVLGSDERGTAYGLLELSRLIGVSPWYWWADVIPEKKAIYTLPVDYVNIQKPSVQYRGIFINDEDWGLTPWSKKTFEPESKSSPGVRTYEKVFELLLRLRANTLWPAMHGVSTPFYFIEGAKETSDKYGIVIGTSHCEPLMRNTNGEWKTEGVGEYNYLTNSKNVNDFWSKRLREVKQYENIYTIGMRGTHDGKMQGVETIDEQTQLLSRIIKEQRNLLFKWLEKDATKIPQVFMPYKEVLDIYNNGLKVPEDITLVWCDDNYGYITKLSNSEEQKRAGGAGVYYHISYFGKPHDYLWLCSTQPGLVYSEMRRAWDYGAQKLWILNAGDIKPGEYITEFFLDMAWDINAIRHDNIYRHLKNWLTREFGKEISNELLFVMSEYYRLAGMRKPEHMGFNRTQEYALTKRKGGATDVEDTQFNPCMFGDELQRRIDDYKILEDIILDCERKISINRRDAYFELIKYPVLASKAINLKILYAQKARFFAQQGLSLANEYAKKSSEAYIEVMDLTKSYNQLIANGKWNGMMDMQPRELPVFEAPVLPEKIKEGQTSGLFFYYPDSVEMIAWNASDCKNMGEAYSIQALGHSMNAVVIPKGEELIYNVFTNSIGEVELRIALIPGHPVNGGSLRYQVSLDDEKEQIVEYSTKIGGNDWKENVLRSQALKSTTHSIVTKGQHTIRIKALDHNIIVDQLMLDFNKDRRFYQIPVNSNLLCK